MPKLQNITTLPKDAVDLLEAVGYLEARELLDANSEELKGELDKANDKFHIAGADPSLDDIAEWKKIASDYDPSDIDIESIEEEALVEQPEEDPAKESSQSKSVNFENDPEVLEMLAQSPDALSLDPSLIRRHKLKVSEIPEGILLTHCEGEVEINLMPPERMSKRQRREAEIKRTGLMSSRIRSFDEADEIPGHVKPLERGENRDSVTLSDGLNQGVSPNSRKFVRGVLHPNPWSVKISAFFALLVEIMLVANFIVIPWLLYHEHSTGDSMLWWVVGLASGLLLSALCYLFWGLSARCRVCGQRQFAPKKCLKNKKAHHIPVIGYIFPTALHTIFFRWFYCTYCGTAVRLKK
ncbi:MAG: hypothetical protein AB8F34_16220 [Akkermansiaceae bacterium]